MEKHKPIEEVLKLIKSINADVQDMKKDIQDIKKKQIKEQPKQEIEKDCVIEESGWWFK